MVEQNLYLTYRVRDLLSPVQEELQDFQLVQELRYLLN
jgi:hypothetical protein